MKKYWYAFIPFIVAFTMWYISLMFEMVSAPSDMSVLVGLLMAGILIFSILFTINKIKKSNEKSN